MRVLYKSNGYRVIEQRDDDASLDDLKGDTYSPSYNSDIEPEQLKAEEVEFEKLVSDEGVFGYTLEKWSPTIGEGWQHVASCWGFIGQYSMDNEHYIVEELCKQIPKGGAQ